MEKKYNIALTPISKSDQVVTLAKKFSAIADRYMLGEKSFPHVTLYQFRSEEKTIDQTWKQVCRVWKEKSIDLEFTKLSCVTFDNHIFWISLSPNHGDILHNMHTTIANILQLPTKKTFDPHMTLVNSKNNKYEKEIALVTDSYKPIVDTFVLSLGASDDIGQLIEIIYRYGT